MSKTNGPAKLFPVKSRFDPLMPECGNLRGYQKNGSIEIGAMMLWNLLFNGFHHFELCAFKKFLKRFFKRVDIFHSVHQYKVRFVSSYVLEEVLYSVLINMFLVQRTTF